MSKIEQLREYMEKEDLDGFYVAKPANVRAVSAYTGEDSFLFITKSKQYFLTDPRYTEQASYECPEYEIRNWRSTRSRSIGEAVALCAEEEKVERIGFEQDYLTFGAWKSMQDAMKVELVPTLNVIEELRAVKTPEEIKNLTVEIGRAHV